MKISFFILLLIIFLLCYNYKLYGGNLIFTCSPTININNTKNNVKKIYQYNSIFEKTELKLLNYCQIKILPFIVTNSNIDISKLNPSNLQKFQDFLSEINTFDDLYRKIYNVEIISKLVGGNKIFCDLFKFINDKHNTITDRFKNNSNIDTHKLSIINKINQLKNNPNKNTIQYKLDYLKLVIPFLITHPLDNQKLIFKNNDTIKYLRIDNNILKCKLLLNETINIDNPPLYDNNPVKFTIWPHTSPSIASNKNLYVFIQNFYRKPHYKTIKNLSVITYSDLINFPGPNKGPYYEHFINNYDNKANHYTNNTQPMKFNNSSELVKVPITKKYNNSQFLWNPNNSYYYPQTTIQNTNIVNILREHINQQQNADFKYNTKIEEKIIKNKSYFQFTSYPLKNYYTRSLVKITELNNDIKNYFPTNIGDLLVGHYLDTNQILHEDIVYFNEVFSPLYQGTKVWYNFDGFILDSSKWYSFDNTSTQLVIRQFELDGAEINFNIKYINYSLAYRVSDEYKNLLTAYAIKKEQQELELLQGYFNNNEEVYIRVNKAQNMYLSNIKPLGSDFWFNCIANNMFETPTDLQNIDKKFVWKIQFESNYTKKFKLVNDNGEVITNYNDSTKKYFEYTSWYRPDTSNNKFCISITSNTTIRAQKFKYTFHGTQVSFVLMNKEWEKNCPDSDIHESWSAAGIRLSDIMIERVKK